MNTIEISKHDPQLQTFLWVSKAKSKDDTRYAIQHIHIEQDPDKQDNCMIAATDGCRLHIAKTPRQAQFKDGNYKVIKETKTAFLAICGDDAWAYPNFKQVIPDCKSEDMQKLFVYCGRAFLDDGQRLFDIAVKFRTIKQGAFNIYYLKDAIGELSDCFVYQRDSVDPVVIKDKPDKWEQLAVVVPYKVN
jgi:hypothetical protein